MIENKSYGMDAVQHAMPLSTETGYAMPYVDGESSPENEVAVHGSVVGCNANNSNASVRTSNSNNNAGNGNDNYVGAWASPIQSINRISFAASEKTTEDFAATGAQGQCDYGQLPYVDDCNAESNVELPIRGAIFDELVKANKKRKLKSLKRFLTNPEIISYAFDRTMSRTHAPRRTKNYWIARKDAVCARIRRELMDQTYHPKGTKIRMIMPRGKGGKIRKAEISAMYDRIVANVLYITIERKFMNMLVRNVYSGVKERSILSNTKQYCMVNIIRHWVSTHPDKYVGQTDIRHFYETLQSKIVIGIMFKTIVCPCARWLLLTIFEQMEYIPIGGCLSQMMAMICINDCDREILRRYRVFYCCFGDNRLIGGDMDEVRKAMSFQMSYYEGAYHLQVKKDYHINPVNKPFTFCKYRFYKSYVSVRAEIRRRAVRSIRKGWQHYAGYRGMLMKTDSKRLRYLIEHHEMELKNKHGMMFATQRGDKRKFKDLPDGAVIIPYEFSIEKSVAAQKDEKNAKKDKCYVNVTYIYVTSSIDRQLCHSTEGSEEIVQFFLLVASGKITLRQPLHIGHTGTQSYFTEYHTTKQEACELIWNEMGLDEEINKMFHEK